MYMDKRQKFVDRIRLQVVGGNGGKGLISFESLDNIKKRPMGGHGGRGGDIIIEASQTVRDLNFPTFVVRGHDGKDASGHGNNGKTGRTKTLVVPVGTIVKHVHRRYLVDQGMDDYSYPGGDGAEEEADAGFGGAGEAALTSSGVLRTNKAGLPFNEDLEVLTDLDVHGQGLMLARGGRPGFGNKGSQLKYNEQVGPGAHRPHIAGAFPRLLRAQ